MYAELEEVPLGYPSVAALVSKSDDLVIFRRFRYLNARNLLYLQAELIDLEDKLKAVDENLEDKELRSWKHFSMKEDALKLTLRIRETLKEYSKKMLLHGNLRGCSSRR